MLLSVTRRVAITRDLTKRIDCNGETPAAAQRAEVGHSRPALPQKRVEDAVLSYGTANDLTQGVDSIGDAVNEGAAQGAEVGYPRPGLPDQRVLSARRNVAGTDNLPQVVDPARPAANAAC